MATLITSFSETLNGADQLYPDFGGPMYFGESFLAGSNYILSSCKFSLAKNGTPTGNAMAYLYATNGSYHSSMKPTGSPLATSDVVSVSSLGLTQDNGQPTDYVLKTFTFTGANKKVLTSGIYYCIVFHVTAGEVNTNTVNIGYSSTNAVGDRCYSSDGSSWGSTAADTLLFEVYGDPLLISSVNDRINISNPVTGITNSQLGGINKIETINISTNINDSLAIPVSVIDSINISENIDQIRDLILSVSDSVNVSEIALDNTQLGDIYVFDSVEVQDLNLSIKVHDSVNISGYPNMESFKMMYGRSPIGDKSRSL
jgi:hypothetical protein